MYSPKFTLGQAILNVVHSPWVLLVVIGGLICLALFWTGSGPIPQDTYYHDFADQRLLFGIPNALNVVSIGLFLLVGCSGLWALKRVRLSPPAYAGLYAVFFIGIGLIGLGSAYYHWSPSNTTLVWDRLPMTVAFMTFTALVFYERVNRSIGKAMFPWLILCGILSVAYWAFTDDLRPYVVVQFVPLISLPIIIWFSDGPGTRWLWLTLSCYLLAKLLELNDQTLMDLSEGQVSGHTLKHMISALGAVMIVIKLGLRELVVPHKS